MAWCSQVGPDTSHCWGSSSVPFPLFLFLTLSFLKVTSSLKPSCLLYSDEGWARIPLQRPREIDRLMDGGEPPQKCLGSSDGGG